MQYPGLKQNMKLDTTIMSFLSKSVAKVHVFSCCLISIQEHEVRLKQNMFSYKLFINYETKEIDM